MFLTKTPPVAQSEGVFEEKAGGTFVYLNSSMVA
jgi:hypothetical protein